MRVANRLQLPFCRLVWHSQLAGGGPSYGKDLREFSFHRGQKAVLCPYWIRTSHGTVRCEKMNVEVFDDGSDPKGAVLKATAHFGADKVHALVRHSHWLPDELKICGMAMDEDWEE